VGWWASWEGAALFELSGRSTFWALDRRADRVQQLNTTPDRTQKGTWNGDAGDRCSLRWTVEEMNERRVS
jgi:hypothetical protein